ncbi:GMP synthase domain protein [Pyrolobus fumarii 1A]|uniref:GMP synthase (glutamine-hydrolyzing) n=1 Tax=Pyrolobus fumarii (strain DSM 11204 / 1A) TaxID=694429 RepID=G0ECN7_PYRF1|nr:GMP synthase domain protein [Pyrolobus fumarii 1A]
MFDVDGFIEKSTRYIREAVGDDCAVVAVSGGVDSTTAAVLAYRALGEKLHPVFIDTGFMRLGEDVHVPKLLRSVLPNLTVLKERSRFYEAVMGVPDAEEKRKRFREVFYRVLSEFAEKVGCRKLVQGTIAPDVIETTGGIKTQHNVLRDVGLDPVSRYGFEVVEPLRELYKDQVRMVARKLGVPREIVERQPFPGPGLLVRCVGACSPEKLSVLRVADKMFTGLVEYLGWRPSQYLVAVWESERHPGKTLEIDGIRMEAYAARATGVKGDARAYGLVYVADVDPRSALEKFLWAKLTSLDRDAVRLVARLWSGGGGKYVVAIRAVQTEDFMTADVALPDRETLEVIVEGLSGIRNVAEIVYDVTPKPPATIEYE